MALFLRPRRAKTRAEPINREHRSQALLSGPDSSQLKEELRLEAAGDPARGRPTLETARSWEANKRKFFVVTSIIFN